MAEADDIRKNTQDIQALTNNVTRLTTIVEAEVENRKDDRVLMKEMVQGFSGLNERISSLIGIERDIKTLSEGHTESKSDIRTLTHDMRDVKQGMGAIAVLTEKLNEASSVAAAHGAKIEGLESFRDRLEGAGVSGLSDRVSKLERESSNKDGKASGTQGTIKVLWDVISTPFWVVVTATATWILTGMYGGKGPFDGK